MSLRNYFYSLNLYPLPVSCEICDAVINGLTTINILNTEEPAFSLAYNSAKCLCPKCSCLLLKALKKDIQVSAYIIKKNITIPIFSITVFYVSLFIYWLVTYTLWSILLLPVFVIAYLFTVTLGLIILKITSPTTNLTTFTHEIKRLARDQLKEDQRFNKVLHYALDDIIGFDSTNLIIRFVYPTCREAYDEMVKQFNNRRLY